MDKLRDSFFRAYFKMPVPRIIVRTDAPVYTVISVNNAYLLSTGKINGNVEYAGTADHVNYIDNAVNAERGERVKGIGNVINQSLFNLFNVDNIELYGQKVLENALSEAFRINEQVYIPEFEISTTNNGSKHVSWWQIEILPIGEDNEKPSYLIITTRDITGQILNQRELEEGRHREQTLHEELAATNEELSASNEELNTTVEELRQAHENVQELNNELEKRVERRTAELIKTQEIQKEQHALLDTIVNEVPAGICVLQGPEMILETANRKILELWKRDEDILGMPLTEIMPEITNQEFPQILNQVYTSGIPYSMFDAQVKLVIDGVTKIVYRDYSYTPIKSNDGTTHSIVAMTIDVTERTLARLREQQLLEEQSAINEELASSNEELATINEELAATNEELHEAQENQQQLITILAKSESRFRNLITEAPVAICVLKGRDHLLDAVNAEGLKILGKTKDIIGKPLQESLSELEFRPFIKLLNGVYQTGETYYGNEIQAQFEHDGTLLNGYFNFIFKPTRVEDIAIDGIIIVASNVTDLVMARKERESAEIKLGLAIEAAQMGSWNINNKTKELQYNSALTTLFGYEGTEPMTYDQTLAQVTDDYKEKLVTEMEKAIANGGAYDITYTQRRFNDGEILWLRSLGKVHFDEHGKPSLFSGVVMNVTEQKRDEQRKNDFIGIVSHELKTPLTSLNGYAQILLAKAKKNDDTFSINALTKVTDQIKKMTAMINGFLNISRLESGKIHLNKQNFNLNELVEENIDEAEILTTNHQIIFKPCGPIAVFADRDKIGSVISNMISNAVKYSPEGKQIEVSCEIIGSSAQISIKDQGLGISEKDIPKLFERFYRVESNQTQLISGFGIGLYLSAEIITHHQGRIWVESEPGHGSTFFFSLPTVE